MSVSFCQDCWDHGVEYYGDGSGRGGFLSDVSWSVLEDVSEFGGQVPQLPLDFLKRKCCKRRAGQ